MRINIEFSYRIELLYLYLSVIYRKVELKYAQFFIEDDIGYAIARANMVKESLKDRVRVGGHIPLQRWKLEEDEASRRFRA